MFKQSEWPFAYLPVRTHNSEVGYGFDVALVHTWNDPNQGKQLHRPNMKTAPHLARRQALVARFDFIPFAFTWRIDELILGNDPADRDVLSGKWF